MKRFLFFITIVCLCLSGQLFAHAAKKEVAKDETMQKLDTQVRTLITEQGDYDAALKVYALAARNNTSQTYYKDQYAILRRVIKMKRAMESFNGQDTLSDSDMTKWGSYYKAVRGYYYDHGFYGESINLDKMASEKLKTEESTINYFESLVVLNNTQKAQELIANSSAANVNPELAVLKALMQVRTKDDLDNNIEEIENKLSPKDAPRSFVYLACIYQLKGNTDKACKSIITALENTIPTQISMTRKLIESMGEFKTLTQNDKYLAAIETESKVYQSGCTGGSSCNSCSLKDTCSSNK